MRQEQVSPPGLLKVFRTADFRRFQQTWHADICAVLPCMFPVCGSLNIHVCLISHGPIIAIIGGRSCFNLLAISRLNLPLFR